MHDARPIHIQLGSEATTRRLEVAARILKSLSLARAHEQELLRLAGKPDFSPEDFFACSRLLAAAPEWFAGALEARLATTGRTGIRELIPDDIRYWGNHPLGAALRARG
jgi:hypothetical protein